MSFFTEEHNGKCIILFCESNLSPTNFKEYLDELGGVFWEAYVAKDGKRRPAWIFPSELKDKIEQFITNCEEMDEVQSNISSEMDLNDCIKEIFSRLDSLEVAVHKLTFGP